MEWWREHLPIFLTKGVTVESPLCNLILRVFEDRIKAEAVYVHSKILKLYNNFCYEIT